MIPMTTTLLSSSYTTPVAQAVDLSDDSSDEEVNVQAAQRSLVQDPALLEQLQVLRWELLQAVTPRSAFGFHSEAFTSSSRRQNQRSSAALLKAVSADISSDESDGEQAVGPLLHFPLIFHGCTSSHCRASSRGEPGNEAPEVSIAASSTLCFVHITHVPSRSEKGRRAARDRKQTLSTSDQGSTIKSAEGTGPLCSWLMLHACVHMVYMVHARAGALVCWSPQHRSLPQYLLKLVAEGWNKKFKVWGVSCR